MHGQNHIKVKTWI